MSKRDWTPRPVGEPAPGYFRLRLVRQGPMIPARIIHASGLWQAWIGLDRHAPATDPAAAPGVFRIWHGGEAISPELYEALMERMRAAPASDPLAHPRQAINLAAMKPLF